MFQTLSTRHLSEPLGGSLRFRRLLTFAALAVIEALLGTFLFDFDVPLAGLSYWQNPVLYANALGKAAVVGFLLLMLVAWPRRREIGAQYRAALTDDRSLRYVAANVALFALLLSFRYALSRSAEVTFGELALYSCLLATNGVSLAFVAAPPRFWIALSRMAPVEIVLASLGGCFAVVTSFLAQESWDRLSGATLELSHWFLTLYESNVLLVPHERILGVGDFRVQVMDACSGYEGVALISVFLSVYAWVFRRDLRFPNALLLIPLGVATVWTFNALRIALLVSIGAHVSPDVAIQGFHSAAGWISFLAVTFGCIALSRRVPYFAAAGRHPHHAVAIADAGPRQPSQPRPALVYLAPFVALVGASIVASAFTPHDQWLYAVKVVAIGAVLWWLRGAYVPLLTRASWFSVGVGLAIGVVWIATDPGRGTTSPLGPWLAALPVSAAILWLSLRAFGSIVLVPIAEELAFRGYLARVLVSARFENVGFNEFRVLAFVGSSLAFGLMHQRIVAACLAGAIYALLMYRGNRLSDAVAAHMASNAAIMLWAVAAQQWTLI
jgi:exosortase E/protease (VPEID-CTERM system)